MGETDWTTSSAPTPPALDVRAFNCAKCGAFAHQSWGHFIFSSAGRGGFTLDPTQRGPGSIKEVEHNWRGSLCSQYSYISIWLQGKMIWPVTGISISPHPDMPADVEELFREASLVATYSRRAAAALARATVERLVKQLDTGEKGTLNDRIGRLEGRTSTGLFQMLDVVRFTGNEALHQRETAELVVIALDDDSGPALVEALLDVANRLVDELIARPAQDNALWDKLPPNIVATIKARSEKEAKKGPQSA